MFVERGCLSYLLIALSSHDATNRLLAYQALNDFYLHSDGSRLQERVEVNFMLDLLNASRVKDGQKLSFVVALFFARVVKLFMYPADPLYMPIFRFLVAKPEMDLSNVPEFYKLFYSSGVQYKQERNWVLSLLCDGMRETADYWLYQKKHIFKILMCFHDSVLSDVHSQGLILSALRNACKEKFVAVDLVKNHGLVSWLLGVVKNLDYRPQHTDLVCDIVHTLWISLTTSKYVVGSQRNQSSLNDSSVLNVNVSLDESKAVGRKASIKDKTKKANKVPAKVEKREGESSEVNGENREEDGENSEENGESSEEDGESSEEDGESSDEEDSNESSEEEDMSGTEEAQTEKREDSVVGKKDELVHQQPSPRATSVPKSTQVEMGFIVKNLICHLSNVSSLDSLTKILEVLHSMISRSGDSETQDGMHKISHTPTNQDHSFSSQHPMGDNADALRLLNLSPNETCLLLYHTAKKLQEEMTARAAEDLLKSRGVAIGLVARQPNKKSSKPETQPHKADKGETTVEGAGAEDKDHEDALSKTLNDETLLVKQGKPGHDVKNVKVEEKKKLLKLMSSIASLTGTLQMV
ncbi:unnamed protein product [Lymnaea stagnalis]|uniref:URB1 C-terminal domain-containing protein n=1 Tax=Lymnaea stagnalis TaxID=6523 RepID=A0AAV2H2D6_LYMST